MKTIRLCVCAIAAFACLTIVPVHADDNTSPAGTMTVSQILDNITTIEKQEVTVVGTVIGACKSGCKMWVADGNYKDGDPYTLVRAKDDAFKFDTKSAGRKVVLTGFAIGEYLDYCGDAAKEAETEGKKVVEEPGVKKGSCEAPVKLEVKKEDKKLTGVTFFATSVKYQ